LLSAILERLRRGKVGPRRAFGDAHADVGPRQIGQAAGKPAALRDQVLRAGLGDDRDIGDFALG